MPKVTVYDKAIEMMLAVDVFKTRFGHSVAQGSSRAALRQLLQCIAFANHMARASGQPWHLLEESLPRCVLDSTKENMSLQISLTDRCLDHVSKVPHRGSREVQNAPMSRSVKKVIQNSVLGAVLSLCQTPKSRLCGRHLDHSNKAGAAAQGLQGSLPHSHHPDLARPCHL